VVHHFRPDKEELRIVDVGPESTVRVADLIVAEQRNLSAGFTEYLKPSRLAWTFDYDEVFYMIEGFLEIHIEGKTPLRFEVGDMGFIEKGAVATIVVPQHAYLLHATQPAWELV
jgi:ethanolamine utilization protein EutQ